jgi:CelD/BcsL family acetyltransferase involved in cellulose biosynthesis
MKHVTIPISPRYSVHSFADLPREALSSWLDMHRREGSLESPYFHPEYVKAVASARPDVRVAMASLGDEPIAFLPFHKGRLGVGTPVGEGLSDYHGIIGRRGAPVTAADLMAAAGLASFRFQHVPEVQADFVPHARVRRISRQVAMVEDADPLAALARSGDFLSQTGRKARKLAREVGDLRFVADTHDPDVWDTLQRWKSDQYVRTGIRDAFAVPWVKAVLRAVHAGSGDGFAGLLSALWAGDRLAAVHFGMRSGPLWHYWFPAYDPELGRYSPGNIMLLEMVRASPALGIRTIDFGEGDQTYKLRLANREVPLVGGTLYGRGAMGGLCRARDALRGAKSAVAARLRGLL